LDKFDELLVKVIDETTRVLSCRGDALILYGYLAKRSCSLEETPEKLDVFSAELRNLLGLGSTADLWSRLSTEGDDCQALYLELEVPYDEEGSIIFADNQEAEEHAL
jgi:hypothetical protein